MRNPPEPAVRSPRDRYRVRECLTERLNVLGAQIKVAREPRRKALMDQTDQLLDLWNALLGESIQPFK